MKFIYNKILKYYAFILFILFCILFPFGQLLRIEKYIFGLYVVIHPIDLIAVLSSPFLFCNNKNRYLSYFRNILFIFASSLIFSIILFKYNEIARGSLYLLRLFFYFSFANLVFYISENSNIKKKLLSMIFISILIFMFYGIIQIIFFFDLRDLIYAGWDNHLYRLTSTLLDPGYSSLIFIIGIIILSKLKLNLNKFVKYALFLLLIASIILTFSRAGYVTLLFISVLYFKKYIKKLVLILAILLLFTFLIPKPRGSGVDLFRISSISSRIGNYKDTLGVFIKYPLLGIGFNNICVYRTNYLYEDSTTSHSCSGTDSSVLLIMATTGVLGIFVFVNSLNKLKRYMKYDEYSNTLKLIFISILISSFFNNSLFYNFILGILAVFIGLTRRRKTIPDKFRLTP